MAAIEEEHYIPEYGRGNKLKRTFPSEKTAALLIVRFTIAKHRELVTEGFLSDRLQNQNFSLADVTVFFSEVDEIVAMIVRISEKKGIQPGDLFEHFRTKFEWTVQEAGASMIVSRITTETQQALAAPFAEAGLPPGTERHAALLKHFKADPASVGWKSFTVIDGQLLSNGTEIRDKGPLP
eukprot:17875-Heterococcus_DN1.PRE.2